MMDGFNSDYKNQQKALANLDEGKINPQELGMIIAQLQDEISTIKKQLENLPGYAVGKNLISSSKFNLLLQLLKN